MRYFVCVILLISVAVFGCSPRGSKTGTANEPGSMVRAAAESPPEVAAVRTPPLPIELVPGRLRNAYPSHSARGRVEQRRGASGWALSLTAQPSTDPNGGEWAGFCWDVAPVEGTAFSRLVLEVPEVAKSEEVEVKLERQSNNVQEVVLRNLEQGLLKVDLSSYARVRPEVARLCLMAIGRPMAKEASTAKFVLARAFLE